MLGLGAISAIFGRGLLFGAFKVQGFLLRSKGCSRSEFRMAQGYGKDLGLSRDSRTGETGLHIYVYIYIYIYACYQNLYGPAPKVL